MEPILFCPAKPSERFRGFEHRGTVSNFQKVEGRQEKFELLKITFYELSPSPFRTGLLPFESK